MTESINQLIIIEHLSKVFRGKCGRQVIALDDVSFTVANGEVFGFLGPNGAGKSTTIKTLMGMIRPGGGEVTLCGEPVGSLASRKSVGYLPENPAFYDFLSGAEYLRFVAKAHKMPVEVATEAINDWLERVSLSAAANRPIRSYSKGMVQRLGLAQALFHDPRVAILDEPMSGLDPQGRAMVKEIILDLKRLGKTIFFSTHITADVEQVCDRLAIIVGGRLQVVESVENVLRHGVTGYRLLAFGDALAHVAGYSVAGGTSSGLAEFRVETAQLSQKIAEITIAGGRIELVEPVRRDLEAYFLEVVERAAT
jgi:ABC-2 type transport system ATP-binding protein